MNRNFEKTKRINLSDNYTTEEMIVCSNKKKNKTLRGGGVKGLFRKMDNSKVNQEKYFVGA